jgi:hypothetical protein
VDDGRWEMVGSSAMGLWLQGWAVVVVSGVVVLVIAGVRCG